MNNYIIKEKKKKWLPTTHNRMNGSLRTGYALSKNKLRGIIHMTGRMEPWEMAWKNYTSTHYV